MSDNTYAEFDGRIKYGKLLAPGQSINDVVFAEKRREDLIREATDGRVIRVVWEDYDHPHGTARRIMDKLGSRAS